jgi:hypothetical protein
VLSNAAISSVMPASRGKPGCTDCDCIEAAVIMV